jgi:hypothetical protein
MAAQAIEAAGTWRDSSRLPAERYKQWAQQKARSGG